MRAVDAVAIRARAVSFAIGDKSTITIMPIGT
jgi:hypothetical protein